MKKFWRKGRFITAAALTLVFSAYGNEAQASPVWNATIAFDHWCYECWIGNVGFSLLCPCRIAPPIVIPAT